MKSAGGILEIIKRDGNLAPYDRDRISSAIFRAMASLGQGDRAQAEALARDVESSLLRAYGACATPSVEEIQDIVEETLMARGAIKTARAYIIYRNQRAQARAARAYAFEVTDNIPYKKIYEVLRWNMDHGCDSISNLNGLIREGHFSRLIRESDRRFEEELDQCAGQILSARGSIRLVIIAGPSSSGKTTTTAKLMERLTRRGLVFKALNVDNYFFDLEQHPKDEFGDYDYEAPQSLDLALINEHLNALLAGETVRTPRYDFKTGKRTLAVEPLRLEPGQILLLDSLHGLYEDMTRSIPAERKFRLYIETLGQLRSRDGAFMRWADQRLMRRMIRDSAQRNSRPETTLTHWHYVRRSELKNIIPFISTADFLANSALPYEIPILKHRVFRYFPEAIARYREDPSRQDAYIRAKRIYDFLAPLTEVADDTGVAADSLLREFIGGSRYET
ncbi:MAG: response regulator SirA [Lentisphaerae bacterium]|nr:response regulator SirA [Lentisphaerota bacterium]